MVLNSKILLTLATLIAIGVFFVGSAFAQQNDDNTRPGWGYGDKNHVHTGPPGQSVRPAQ
jgi:hypothetical protein